MENQRGGLRHGGGGGQDDTDSDDQEESSSSQTGGKINALEEFRREWKRELDQSTPRERSPFRLERNSAPLATVSADHATEDKAKVYFQMGIDFEKKGKLYDAVEWYRRAVQLVPDIEFKMFQQSGESRAESTEVSDSGSDVEVEDEESGLPPGVTLVRSRAAEVPLALPLIPALTCHFSSLPVEIFLYILRWVVSPELDLRSLEMCSQVCRGFYICCRDPEIWKIACTRVWGVKCGTPGNTYRTWRDMYIKRPRVLFGGCYISKTTYLRHGENSFQDQFYRPWHLVEYFRYMRFYPDGRCTSLTSSEEPSLCVALLKNRSPPVRHPPVCAGYYRLVGTTVSIVVSPITPPDRRQANNRAANANRPSSSFHLELEIASYKSRRHVQLHWRAYSVFTRSALGVETVTPFDLNSSRYPPFIFSRVKSYVTESTQPLCK